MAEYKISLGVQLDTNDIITQINEAERKVDPITIKVDAETKELTKSIQDALKTLSGGTKNALTLDTSKFEGSIADIKSAVVDLKKVLASLDDSTNMKSLLVSVNQIANAIGKVTDESETLAKSLSVLSKKDFGFNFNLKTGNANPLKAATDYGKEARRNAIPALQEQASALQNLLGGYQKADRALEIYLTKIHKASGISIKNNLVDDMSNTSSLAKQMEAIEKYIGYLKKIATEKGINLSGFDAQFAKTAESIVDDTTKIQTGAKQTEEALEAVGKEMKQVFGSGIGAEQFSAELKPIIDDLHSIQQAITSLSKETSLGGLTASFNRLSESIENLLANAEKVKGVLNSGFDVNDVGSASTSTPSSTSAVKSAQQTGQKIGETVTKSTQQALNLDDVIDEQVTNLMNQYGIVGKKGSKAFEEIKQAIVEYRAELTALGSSSAANDGFIEIFDEGDVADIRKVTDALTSNMKIADQTTEVYEDLVKWVREINNSGHKIYLPDSIKQEYGDDFASMRSQLGKAFTTQRTSSSVDFEVWLEELNGQLGNVIDLSNGAEAAFGDLVNKLRMGRDVNFLSGDDLVKSGMLDMDDMEFDVINALGAIEEGEKQLAQVSSQTANAIVQSEERKQQAYRETSDAYEKISRDTSLTRDDVDFQKTFEASSQAAQEAQRHFQELLADEKAVVSVTEQFDDSNALQSFTVNIKRASGEVETLRYAMDKLNDEGSEGFKYQGGSANDSRLYKQIEMQTKKANDLQTKLEKIQSSYKDANASKPIKDDDHIRSLDVQYRKVEKAINDVRFADDATFSSMLSNAEKQKAVLESMVREYRNAENVATSLRSKDISTVKDTYASKLDVLVSKMKTSGVYTDGFEKGAKNLRSVLSDATDASGLVKFLNGLDKLEAGYKRADAAAREFNRSQKVGINTSGLESKIADLQRISPEIDKFETEIDGAKVSVQSLINDLKQVKTQGDFSVVNARFKAFTDAAKAAGIAVTEVAQKAKSINDIKIKIADTGFNGFEQEVLRARNAAEELEGVYPDLEAALKRLDTAMEDVYSADQAGDVKRLVAANEEYEASLKQVYSQLKLYQQTEQKAYKAEMLNQKKATLSSEMKSWLKENTRAAKDFGEEIRRLDASLDGLDGKGVKLVGQQFKSITKQAQAMGKTGLTTFDRLKSKAKEYMSYLSAAEMFMYAEQAFRSMFEQVQLIDTAMTELKKVTDETDASYNKFLSNAASRSKELGTTIDGLVSSTADFARLGYGFEDAQGLAEVANVYAVVGDEIEGVEGATESLISTMAAFKDSAKGMSNSDFAMSIIDKFNEIGKLIA